MNIVFIILNYNIVKETLDCVRSIEKNIDTDSYHILIVDNGSETQAGRVLRRALKDDRRVSVAETGENLGFARGNNFGFRLAEKMNPRFICCMNNDIILHHRHFWKTIKRVWRQYRGRKIGIIGPAVYIRDYTLFDYDCQIKHREYYQSMIERMEDALAQYESTGSFPEQSPLEEEKRPIEVENRFKRMLLENNVIYDINRARRDAMKYLRSRTDFLRYFATCRGDSLYWGREQLDKIVHGCCIIFTPLFLKKLKGFNSETFMFNEEELLFLDVREQGLHSLYCPRLAVQHLEDVSTDRAYGTEDKKLKFIYSNKVKSMKILLRRI